jgi:hypothetical protein
LEALAAAVGSGDVERSQTVWVRAWRCCAGAPTMVLAVTACGSSGQQAPASSASLVEVNQLI